MSEAQLHIVRRQTVDIAVADDDPDAFALQRRLSDLCRDWLTPAIATAFDRANPGGDHWTIERLEVDAGVIGLDDLEGGFVPAIAEALERKLRDHAAALGRFPPSGEASADSLSRDRAVGFSPGDASPFGRDDRSPASHRSEGEAVRDAFLHFVSTGLLPWWFRLPEGTRLEDAVAQAFASSDERARLMRALLAAPLTSAMTIRLARQFSPPFLRSLLSSVSSEGAATLDAVLARLDLTDAPSSVRRTLTVSLRETAFLALAAGRPLSPESIIPAWLQRVERDAGPAGLKTAGQAAEAWPEVLAKAKRSGAEPPRTDEEVPGETPDLDEGVDVDCAGIVLLHPFLPQLFKALGIAEDEEIVAPDRALAMLHFLATGEDSAPEHALFLPKLLCGLNPATPAPAPAVLTEFEKEEGVALLAAVIGHWGALGDASVDALRGTFLVRPGKFRRRSNGDAELQVETRSFDILLDTLPWTVGAVRLPWMAMLLWVLWWSN